MPPRLVPNVLDPYLAPARLAVLVDVGEPAWDVIVLGTLRAGSIGMFCRKTRISEIHKCMN
jgi:hypothetical protein